MKIIILTCTVLIIPFILGMAEGSRISNTKQIITAIQDNGCSSHQELSQTKSNAEIYNYAALSTSY